MYVEALNTGHEELFGLALWNVVGEAASEDPLIDPRKDDSVGEKRPLRFRWMYVFLLIQYARPIIVDLTY